VSAGHLETWLGAATEAFAEVASTTLGMAGARVGASRSGYPSAGVGAAIAIIADAPMQVGVFGSRASSEAFARALLGMEPDDGDLSDADFRDALGEIVNIVAGSMKTRLKLGGAKLGLPLFVTGRVEAGCGSKVRVASVHVGDHVAEVFMMCEAVAA
jgi:CheY-specific phosphatase CheX